MTLPLSPIYKEIGNTISISIQEEWKSARVVFEFTPEVYTVQGRFLPTSGGKEHSFIVDKTIISHFQELHSKMSQTPKGNWKRAIFELQRDGKFDMKFEY
jgi:hypothetical protein